MVRLDCGEADLDSPFRFLLLMAHEINADLEDRRD